MNNRFENRASINSYSPELKRTTTRLSGLAENIKQTLPYQELLQTSAPRGESFKVAAQYAAENNTYALGTDNVEIKNADVDALNTLAHLGGFIQAQQEIDALYSQEDLTGYLTPEEKERRKELKMNYLIPFNHSLKSYVNSHADDGLKETAAAFASVYSAHFGDDDNLGGTHTIPTPPSADEIRRYTEAALRGMRSELAAETMLDAAGYCYEYHISAEEDSHGTDLYVYMNDDWEAVDIKASLSAERNAHDKAYEKGFYSRAVWTGLYDSDYTGAKGDKPGSMRIPYETAQEAAENFINSIHAMAMEQRPVELRS